MKPKISNSKSSASSISNFERMLCALKCTKDQLCVRSRELSKILDIPEDELLLLLVEAIDTGPGLG